MCSFQINTHAFSYSFYHLYIKKRNILRKDLQLLLWKKKFHSSDFRPIFEVQRTEQLFWTNKTHRATKLQDTEYAFPNSDKPIWGCCSLNCRTSTASLIYTPKPQAINCHSLARKSKVSGFGIAQGDLEHIFSSYLPFQNSRAPVLEISWSTTWADPRWSWLQLVAPQG